MKGLGTIVNVAAVLAGSFAGMLFRRGISEKLQDALTKALGVAVMFVGLSGTLAGMLVFEGGAVQTKGSMLLILSLVLGALAGELLGIERRLEALGDRLQQRTKEKSSRFTEGFVNASLVFCVGAMAILGALQDGLTGDASMLYTKSLMDGIFSLIYASAYGVGVACSALAVGVYQGAITLLAGLAAPYLAAELVADLSCVGSALIFAIGINQVFGKRIAVGNLLPALLVPVLYHVFFL